jgi:hypothetical protein
MNPSLSTPNDDVQDPRLTRGVFRLAWRALLLQEDAYGAMLGLERPFRSGLSFLTRMLLPVALAISLGLLLDYLTMPRLEQIQNQLWPAIIQIGFIDAYLTQAPYLTNLLSLLYEILWFIIRSFGNYPSIPHIVVSILLVLVSGIFDWITYALIAQWVARWLGADFERNAFYAPMALAYAPKLLLIINLLPGLTVPAGLVRFWIFATSYQAIRGTFKLSWKRSLVVVLLPYLITTILLILSVTLGIIVGVAISQLIYA